MAKERAMISSSWRDWLLSSRFSQCSLKRPNIRHKPIPRASSEGETRETLARDRLARARWNIPPANIKPSLCREKMVEGRYPRQTLAGAMNDASAVMAVPHRAAFEIASGGCQVPTAVDSGGCFSGAGWGALSAGARRTTLHCL